MAHTKPLSSLPGAARTIFDHKHALIPGLPIKSMAIAYRIFPKMVLSYRFASQVPRPNILGISLACIDYAPWGATEILTVLEGDVFVFPIGLVHYQRNVGYGNAVAIAALSNQNPGVISIANPVFVSEPAIETYILAKAFQVDESVMAAYTAVISLLQTLEQLQERHPVLIQGQTAKTLESLHNTAEYFQNFVEEASKSRFDPEKIKSIEEIIKSAASDAEDVIEMCWTCENAFESSLARICDRLLKE
ncbi:putative germin-like protein 2-3 [Capsicum chinense]|nr:putative germin-like protein 2-3 [Capsicum chinense]